MLEMLVSDLELRGLSENPNPTVPVELRELR